MHSGLMGLEIDSLMHSDKKYQFSEIFSFFKEFLLHSDFRLLLVGLGMGIEGG